MGIIRKSRPAQRFGGSDHWTGSAWKGQVWNGDRRGTGTEGGQDKGGMMDTRLQIRQFRSQAGHTPGQRWPVSGRYPSRQAEFTLAMVVEETPEVNSGPEH